MSDNSSTMKLQSLSEIFNKKIFRIPDYQRGYAWETQQLEDFYSDLERLQKINSENSKNSEQEKMHYCGLLTVKKQEEIKDDKDYSTLVKSKDKELYHIIDGQQRLTTSIIFIKVFIEKLASKETYEKYIVTKIAEHSKCFIFGYENDDPSFEYFIKEILGFPNDIQNKDAQQSLYTERLKQAKDFFEDKLKGLQEEKVEQLLKTLTENFMFNFYLIDDKKLDINVTFETMNNRGKELTTLELLKNRLFYLTHMMNINEIDKKTIHKKITVTWKDIYGYLGKDPKMPLNDDLFLREHWITYFPYTRKKNETFKTELLNKHFSPDKLSNEAHNNFYTFIRQYLDSIHDSIKLWFYINKPENSCEQTSLNDAGKTSLLRLKRLGFSYFRPLILSAYLNLEAKKIDNTDFNKLLVSIEKFIFCYFTFARNRLGKLDSTFYKYAESLGDYKQKEPKEVIEGVIKILSKNSELDKNDIETFLKYISRNEEKYYGWNGIRYFLYEYEDKLRCEGRDAEKKVKWEDTEGRKKDSKAIEHIYPQNAESKDWGKFDDRPDVEKKKLTHSLGNLVLIGGSKNSSVSNNGFDKKRDAYKTGSYSQREVSIYTDWTPQTILDRGKELLEFLEKRWGITISDDDKQILLGLYFLP